MTEQIESVDLPICGWKDCENASWRLPGEACTCDQCGERMKNLLGLRVHFQYMHSHLPGVVKRTSRKGMKYKQVQQTAQEIPAGAVVSGSPASAVNYCPSCGCNMKAVAVAMRITGGK